MSGIDAAAMEELEEFYRDLEKRLDPLRALHQERLRCGAGCADCCVDGITVFGIEADRIRRRRAGILDGEEPAPVGVCAFLDGGGRCRIYEDRPYVCRTQGLPLRWIERRPDGMVAEMRDICPRNEEGPPVEALDAGACWTLGPFEGRLAGLQAAVDGGEGSRVPLRSLFRRGAALPPEGGKKT
ncbi:MAG: YkgJ family cysteine cluster protein [Candidatus Eisenbacteria bacterium]|nr:YkgJ family cysteine cluster protein [Candidatus Eisenbacteria bacterium]